MSSSGVHGPFLTPTPLSQHGGLPMPAACCLLPRTIDTPSKQKQLATPRASLAWLVDIVRQVVEEQEEMGSCGCCLHSHGGPCATAFSLEPSADTISASFYSRTRTRQQAATGPSCFISYLSSCTGGLAR